MNRRPVARAGLTAVVTVALAAGSLTACSPGASAVHGPTVSRSTAAAATVGLAGVTLARAGVTVTGPVGAAPDGATLAISDGPRALPAGPAQALTTLGPGVTVSLSSGQPAQPLTITFRLSSAPAAGVPLAVASQEPGHDQIDLSPATYDPVTSTLSAKLTHLSIKWPVALNISALADAAQRAFTGTFGLTSPRPACAGAPTTISGVKVSLPQIYSGQGDGVVWPCLSSAGDDLAVDLSSDSGLPWRSRAAPNARLDPAGDLDLSKAALLAGYQTLAATRPHAEGILVPTGHLTYHFRAKDLPAVVQLHADLGSHLALTVLFTIDFLMTVTGTRVPKLLSDAKVLGCVADAVTAAGQLGRTASVDALTTLARAVITCAAVVAVGFAGTVLAVLGSGVGLVFAGLQGAWRSATSTDLVTIALTPSVTPRPCVAADLFDAAVAREHFDPHDPGYRTAGAAAGAYDALCIGSWATATISRPNVGTTDGGTLFHRGSDGRWVETAAIEWPFVACALTPYGVPPADAVKLTREKAFNSTECHS